MRTKIKEGILIHQTKSRIWKCVVCEGDIIQNDTCVALYDLVYISDMKKLIQTGNGVKVHLSCINSLHKMIKEEIEKNYKKEAKSEVKRIMIRKLK